MTKNDIRKILVSVIDTEDEELDLPTEDDWKRLEQKFETEIPDEFRWFIELMTEFKFPGDILHVAATGRTNGNDTIEQTYDYEVEYGWPKNLLPFYAIGNGDYFCIDATLGKNSPVFYRFHEDGVVEREYRSFSDWIIDLPDFLE